MSFHITQLAQYGIYSTDDAFDTPTPHTIKSVVKEPMGHQGHMPSKKLQHAHCAPPPQKKIYTWVIIWPVK